MKKPVYVCRRLSLNIFLQARGFKPFAQRPDKFDSNKMVWIYGDSISLRLAVGEYYKR